MKLILCKKCQDIIRLREDVIRKCDCGETSGSYTDDINAWYSGDHAVPIGFNNRELLIAIRNVHPEDDRGYDFSAFVISTRCPTFQRK